MTPYYDDGQCVIYHGNCGEILPGLDRSDAVVTDPPYGMGAVLHAPGKRTKPKWTMFEDGAPEWDAEAPAIVSTFPFLAEHCIIWGGQFFVLPQQRGWLVWDKIVREFSSGHCELAWTNLEQPVRAFNFSHGQLATEGKLHPTQKPLSLMSWCLSFIPDAASVLDPFMGSGTTLVAAKAPAHANSDIHTDKGESNAHDQGLQRRPRLAWRRHCRGMDVRRQ